MILVLEFHKSKNAEENFPYFSKIKVNAGGTPVVIKLISVKSFNRYVRDKDHGHNHDLTGEEMRGRIGY